MYACVKFSKYILNFNYITVNFRKTLYSCQAIPHFFTNLLIIKYNPSTPSPPLPPELLKIYIFSKFTPPTDTAITKKHHKTSFCIFTYSL